MDNHDEMMQILQEAKASWQDKYGLAGPQPDREPLPVHEPFEVKTITSFRGEPERSPTPIRPSLDSAYDN